MCVLPAKRLTFIKRAGLSGTFVTGALKTTESRDIKCPTKQRDTARW